ncbi:uncharacterized protein LOC134359676 [Mobula hypostoma]|uniref:uncharacterized protein LOC134359676 n=1 Tax=Mobula hypostoma TaxID=723540 RepID=UPI002FC3A353
MHNESSSFNSETLTDGGYPVTQASAEILGESGNEASLLRGTVNTTGCNGSKDTEGPRPGADMRRAGRAGAVSQSLDQKEGALVKADIAGAHRNTGVHNDTTSNTHAEATGSNSEGEGSTIFKEWIYPKRTEEEAVPSHQPDPPEKQELRRWIVAPSRDHEAMRQTTKVRGFEAKQNDAREKEKAQRICVSERYRDNAIERDVYTLPTVNITIPSSAGYLIEKQAGEEDTLISALSVENQGQGFFSFQSNPTTNERGWQERNAAGSRECLMDPDDTALLPAMGKDLREFSVIDCEVSLAGEVGLAAGRGQAEVWVANGDLRAGNDELGCNASVVAPTAGGGDMERECPVCTEPFDTDAHKQAQLNCNHSFCDSCVKTIMEKAAARSSSQIRCPVCRQRTPMPEWEIRQLQEEMTFLSQSQAGRADGLVEVPAHAASQRGLCSWLEQGLQQRLRTTRRCGYLPCLRYPLWLVNALARCDQSCSCCYLCSILLLYGLELLCLSLIFTPVIVLVLLFTLLGKE